MSRFRPRLTYANVMSSIAVFGILAGGGAWAHGKIGSGQIKNNAVAAKHIKNNGVRGRAIANNGVSLNKLKNDVLFAQVTNQGNLIDGRSRGARDASLESDLSIIVSFSRNVSRCHPFASLRTTVPRFATVGTPGEAPGLQANQIRVLSRNQNGNMNNQPFSLLLLCP